MFKHQPLDLTRQQIRLLRLHPTPENEDAQTSPIQCEIMTVDAKDAIYTTLSYVWGPPSPNQTIQVNGEPFVVRQNLFDFLKVFRDDDANCTSEPLHLWIDQLCIDQDNELERNHQVQMMSDIYRGCQYVIIWLHGLWAWIARVFKKTNLPSALEYLFTHEYFTRLWIVQEILLSPHVEVLCGNVWLSWDEMRKVHQEKWPHNISDISLFPLFYLTHPEMSVLTKHSGIDLHSCLENFMSQSCQLNHDRIYGLLGLVKPEQRPTVDYNKAIEEVFVECLLIFLPLTTSPRTRSPSNRRDKYKPEHYDRMGRSLGIDGFRGFYRFWQDIEAIEKAEAESKNLNDKSLFPHLIEELGFTPAVENGHKRWSMVVSVQRSTLRIFSFKQRSAAI